MTADRVELPHGRRRETMGLDAELITHRIGDEELTLLADPTRSMLGGIFSAALGANLTAVAPAIDAWERASQGLTSSDLVMLAIFFGIAPLVIVAGTLWLRQQRRVRSLQHAIRQRHRQPVESAPELRG